MATNMTRTELADWRAFCDKAAVGPDAAVFSVPGAESSPVHPRDAAVLYALRDLIYAAVIQVSAAGIDRAVVSIELPSAYWMRPQGVAGAMLYGRPVHLSDDLAWPAVRVELPRV